MARTSTLVAAALLAACNLVSGARLLGTEKMSTSAIMALTASVDRAMLAAHSCLNQSCLVADTAGSTGRIPFMKAEGATDDDIKCIVAHNPDIGDLLKAYNNNPPLVPKQPLTVSSSFIGGLNNLGRPIVAANGETETGSFDGTCAPNILIFAKGTLEPGAFGVTLGPKLQSGMPSSGWSIASVAYDASIQGDYCLGLPGGRVATAVINDANRKCPNSNLYVSGYSQGAMVARNGIAHANPAAVAKIKGVVVFGDPFNGAEIQGYKGPIKIYCNDGDGVCGGNFELRPAHLAYAFDDTATQAWQVLQQMSRGQGDQSCCIRPPQPLPPSPDAWRASIQANGGKVPIAAPGTTVEAWGQALANSNGGIPAGTVNRPGASSSNGDAPSFFGGLFGRDVEQS